MADYLTGLPSETDISQSLQWTLEHWRERNQFIADVRKMIAGMNKIQAPTSTQYKIRTMHTFYLATAVNEKAARFVHMPRVQVIPDEHLDPEARRESSDMEIALKAAMYEMERHGDGDVWGRMVLDAILLDEGVERIERAPAAFWPELLRRDEEGNLNPVFEDEDLTNAYKKDSGFPIRSVYVPLENWYPIYEGSTPVESFEFEQRSVRSILRNPLFNTQDIHLGQLSEDKLKAQATIVHYVNQNYHAYYLLPINTSYDTWPNPMESHTYEGPVHLLHAYEHELGETLYNNIAGRFGGWKGPKNSIEGISKGLLELNQVADEVMSQVFTNIRAKYWPSLVHKIDPEHRAVGTGSPKPLEIPEGQNVAIYKDEEIEPIFKPVNDDSVPWFMDQVQGLIGRLGGSPVLFGVRQPGVETGYHQSLQITQSEHLDEKIEQHLSFGAIQRVTKILKHIKAMDMGKVWVHHSEIEPTGKRSGRWLFIDPKHLVPLPRLDAAVRRPRPVDFAASVRAAREASDDRGGKGPLMADATIREQLLNVEAPDIENRKIIEERAKREILDSGVIAQKVQERLNLLMAQSGVPQLSPEQLVNADPAISAAIQQMQQPGANGTNGTGGVPLPPGQTTGQSQPEQAVGQEMQDEGAMPISGVLNA